MKRCFSLCLLVPLARVVVSALSAAAQIPGPVTTRANRSLPSRRHDRPALQRRRCVGDRRSVNNVLLVRVALTNRGTAPAPDPRQDFSGDTNPHPTTNRISAMFVVDPERTQEIRGAPRRWQPPALFPACRPASPAGRAACPRRRIPRAAGHNQRPRRLLPQGHPDPRRAHRAARGGRAVDRRRHRFARVRCGAACRDRRCPLLRPPPSTSRPPTTCPTFTPTRPTPPRRARASAPSRATIPTRRSPWRSLGLKANEGGHAALQARADQQRQRQLSIPPTSSPTASATRREQRAPFHGRLSRGSGEQTTFRRGSHDRNPSPLHQNRPDPQSRRTPGDRSGFPVDSEVGQERLRLFPARDADCRRAGHTLIVAASAQRTGTLGALIA